MLIQTKYFGEIDCQEDHFLHFPHGLYGFEEERRFALLPFADSEATLLALQSLQTPALCFVLMNPFSIMPNYMPILQQEELHTLQVAHSEELCYYVLCRVKNPISDSTVNLKCPLVINDTSKQAMQVILESEDYEMRHPLSDFTAREAETPC